MTEVVTIGDRQVGAGHPCFVVAEVGINHNGDMELAERSIDAAARAGADAVKFQNYRTEDFVSDRSLTYEYVSQGRTVVESQYEMFKRAELGPGAVSGLAARCRDAGVEFMTTPTSEDGIADAVAAGATSLKNGSDYLPHLELIRAMAATGLPTVLSTGMSTIEEIGDAVEAFREAGGTNLVLLQCTSSYPAEATELNLAAIPALAERFECPSGLSDHSSGRVAAVGAVALGASMIEKHFTLDRELPGPDHRFSSDPEELAHLVADVRYIESAIGSAALVPAASEREARSAYRVSCVAARDLPEDHPLAASDIAFRRPGTGLPPKRAGELVGRSLRRSVSAGEPLTEDAVR